ncbi:Carboxylesterase [Danaus plexippus plexippus]|uniref:Carboxylesterase n=1 Tax=Danaus plexippus plexippus TaxID=278856 RepID=A0A212EXW2_DANPL|nr:Carboxylesterase [Danaus plexippus plexippus]
MSTILLAALIASVSSENIKDRESLLVQISSGLVRGYKDIHEDVFVFNGIPYATAPTGTERFKPHTKPTECLLIMRLPMDKKHLACSSDTFNSY